MKKQILACTLALLSAFTTGLRANQPSTDHLSKVKFLNGTLPHIGLPDMPRHYAAFRAGCINASWIAKNPVVQKFVEDNFNTIAQTAGGIFATMVSLFAIRTLYRWNNNRTFKARCNTDPVYCEQVLQTAASGALSGLNDTGLNDKGQLILLLEHSGYFGKLGIVTVSGKEIEFKDNIRDARFQRTLFKLQGANRTFFEILKLNNASIKLANKMASCIANNPENAEFTLAWV